MSACVYALVAKNGRIHFLAEQGAKMNAAQNVRAVEHSMALEDQAAGGIEDKIEEETRGILKTARKMITFGTGSGNTPVPPEDS